MNSTYEELCSAWGFGHFGRRVMMKDQNYLIIRSEINLEGQTGSIVEASDEGVWVVLDNRVEELDGWQNRVNIMRVDPSGEEFPGSFSELLDLHVKFI